MLRLRRLVAQFALACAVIAAPAAAQGPVTSLADQLRQQALHDALRAQQEAALRSLALRRNGAAPEAEPKTLPPIRLAALEDSVARYDQLHRQQRRWSQVLLTVGAAAVVGGFANHVAGDSSLGMSGMQRALIWGGFGITVISAEQGKAADRAWAQAEHWRTVQHLASQQPRR